MDDIRLEVSSCTKNPNPKPGDDTYFRSNTRNITGWTNIRVTRGIERVPADFEIEFTEPYPGRNQVVVQAGDECRVYLGSDLVLTGYIDRYIPSFDKTNHTIRISGRSKSQDLCDCSAKWEGMQFLNSPILLIAQRLCAVYGIKVRLDPDANQGDPIEQTNIFASEPIYDVLELLCRFRALLMYDDPDGSLLLSGIRKKHAASGFTEGINVLSASAMYGMDGRFSDYDALRMNMDMLSDVGEGGNLIAHVSDPGVPRFRYKVIISEQVAGGAEVAAQRAKWEMARRYGRAFQVKLTTDSWRDSAGALYEPNTLVPLDLPGLKMREPQTWLISEVTYKRDENGTTADLVIMPPEAFYQQPILLNPVAPDINKA